MHHDTASCFVCLDGDVLAIGNALINRRWQVCDGLLVPLALTAGDRDWQAASRPPRRPPQPVGPA